MATNMSHYIPSNPTQNIQTCSSLTSSTLMPHQQENIASNNYPSSIQMPYTQDNNPINCPLPTPTQMYRQEHIPNHNHLQYAQNIPSWQQPHNSPAPLINNQINEARSALQSISNNKLQERLDNMDEQLQRILKVMQNISKDSQKPKHPVKKPAILPITSMEQMVAFENIEEDTYLAVVHYFEFLGGFQIKEVVNICLKEAIIDDITPRFTWWGNEHKKPFSETRLVHAIYEAASNNVHFKAPTRLDFQKNMKEALRTSQERYRSRRRNKQQAVQTNRYNRDYWNNNENNTTSTENTEPSTDE